MSGTALDRLWPTGMATEIVVNAVQAGTEDYKECRQEGTMIVAAAHPTMLPDSRVGDRIVREVYFRLPTVTICLLALSETYRHRDQTSQLAAHRLRQRLVAEVLMLIPTSHHTLLHNHMRDHRIASMIVLGVAVERTRIGTLIVTPTHRIAIVADMEGKGPEIRDEPGAEVRGVTGVSGKMTQGERDCKIGSWTCMDAMAERSLLSKTEVGMSTDSAISLVRGESDSD